MCSAPVRSDDFPEEQNENGIKQAARRSEADARPFCNVVDQTSEPQLGLNDFPVQPLTPVALRDALVNLLYVFVAPT